jgi:uncharacterized protein (TIGR02757 family)
MNLTNILQKIYADYHTPDYLYRDPLCCVRRYGHPHDIEIAGLIASCLAYGRVEQIIRGVETVLSAFGGELRRGVTETSLDEKLRALRGFKHRFNDHHDVALLCEAAGRAIRRYGSLEACFKQRLPSTTGAIDARESLHWFVARLKQTVAGAPGADKPGFRYLLPSPFGGSACKRLNMYLRWMVRRNDGIDLGVWNNICTSTLIMPVDAHVARVARALNITNRASADWIMAEQITGQLKKIEPMDPVKYDFSLCRYGMTLFREGAASGATI